MLKKRCRTKVSTKNPMDFHVQNAFSYLCVHLAALANDQCVTAKQSWMSAPSCRVRGSSRTELTPNQREGRGSERTARQCALEMNGKALLTELTLAHSHRRLHARYNPLTPRLPRHPSLTSQGASRLTSQPVRRLNSETTCKTCKVPNGRVGPAQPLKEARSWLRAKSKNLNAVL